MGLKIGLIFQSVNLLTYIKYNKFFCDLWIFFKKNEIFLHFFCRFSSASHLSISLYKMPIATATAQGGTYTNSLTFYILKNNKKKADEAIFFKKN